MPAVGSEGGSAMIHPSYKDDLTPDNELRRPCAWCGERAIILRHGIPRCARHDRTRGTPPMTTDQSPVAPPTPDDLASAIGVLVTTNGALEIARKARRP